MQTWVTPSFCHTLATRHSCLQSSQSSLLQAAWKIPVILTSPLLSLTPPPQGSLAGSVLAEAYLAAIPPGNGNGPASRVGLGIGAWGGRHRHQRVCRLPWLFTFNSGTKKKKTSWAPTVHSSQECPHTADRWVCLGFRMGEVAGCLTLPSGSGDAKKALKINDIKATVQVCAPLTANHTNIPRLM